MMDQHYLQHEYLSSRLVDVKLGLSLAAQEVDDVLLSVLVAGRGRHLERYNSVTTFRSCRPEGLNL